MCDGNKKFDGRVGTDAAIKAAAQPIANDQFLGPCFGRFEQGNF